MWRPKGDNTDGNAGEILSGPRNISYRTSASSRTQGGAPTWHRTEVQALPPVNGVADLGSHSWGDIFQTYALGEYIPALPAMGSDKRTN